MTRTVYWTAACMGLLLLLVLLLIPATSHTQSIDPTKITNCTTISVPGSYFVNNDITATPANVQTDAATSALACIEIATDFVTLDLVGHTIFGPPGGRINGVGVTGIFTFRHNGIEVHSGAVTSFFDGVGLQGSGLRVEKIRAFNNLSAGVSVTTIGIGTSAANGQWVVGNTAINNFDGIIVTCPAVVLENVADGNSNLQIVGEGVGCTQMENSPAP